MPRRPLGEKAMTAAERQRKRREQLRKENPVLTDRQKLLAAQQRVRVLEAALAAKPASKPARPAPASEELRQLHGKLLEAKFESDHLREQLAKAKAAEPEQVSALRQRVRDLEQEHARRDGAARAAQTKAEKPAWPRRTRFVSDASKHSRPRSET
jgi:GTP1/Obg family GTP-binding protein